MLETVSRVGLDHEPGYRREYVSRSDIAHFIRRNFLSVLVPLFGGLLVALLYVLLVAPTFTARTQLLIDPKTPQALRDGLGEASLALDSSQVESQIAVLRSSEVALAVIARLKLMDEPEFQPGRKPTEASPISDLERRTAALGRFDGQLDVRRVGISYAIDISFTARKPELAAAVANATAEAYLQELFDTRARSAKVASEWLEERVTQLRRQMNNAARRVQEFRASQDYRIVRKQSPQAPDPLAPPAAPAAQAPGGEPVTLDELETTAQTYRKIYESFYQAFAEAVQRESYPISNARVISKASVPLSKSNPKTMLVLALGGLVGLLSGLGIAFVRHSLERVVRSPQQVREEIGLDCLGLVPTVGVGLSEPLPVRAHRAFKRMIGRTDDNEPGAAYTAAIDNPFSPYSEGLKRVRTNIALAGKTRPMSCVGITSSLPEEGKTTTAANLAALYAVAGARTLLIDGDARKATLSRRLAPLAEAGVLQVLQGACELDDAVVQISHGGYDLMPVATKHDHFDEAGAMASEQMGELLRKARDAYQIVIVDLPPLRSVAEALPVCGFVDGVVIVSEWEETPLPELADVVHSLRKAQANIVGTVITKVNVEAGGSYVQSGLAYGYGGFGRDG